MKAIAIKVDTLLQPLRNLADRFASPLLDLSFRLYVGWIFFRSGKLRFNDFLNGTWDRQEFLFSDIHPVPGLPVSFTAPAATAAEIILPVLLFLGLFTRFGAAGLIVMTLVIEFTYEHDPNILIRSDHLVWLAMLSVIFIKGPSKLSLDHWLVNWLRKDANQAQTTVQPASRDEEKTPA